MVNIYDYKKISLLTIISQFFMKICYAEGNSGMAADDTDLLTDLTNTMHTVMSSLSSISISLSDISGH